jgi:hypothetical protein
MKEYEENSAYNRLARRREEGYLPVVNRSISICIPLMDILYIRREGRVIWVKTLDEEYYCYESMDTVMRFLNGHFYQSLKGFLVNLRNIREMKEQCIEFAGGSRIRLAYKPYCRTKQVYSNYIMNGRKGFVQSREDRLEG